MVDHPELLPIKEEIDFEDMQYRIKLTEHENYWKALIFDRTYHKKTTTNG